MILNVSMTTKLLACAVFPILLVSVFVLQNIVSKMRREIMLAEYEITRGPIEDMPRYPDESERLPGYMTLTNDDYDKAYRKVAGELMTERLQKSANGGGKL